MRAALTFFIFLPVAVLVADHHDEQTTQKLYPDAPLLPGSIYSVHDTTRPQPRKVVSAGALIAPAPSDATVLFDGRDTKAWNGSWKVVDGLLIASKGALTSKEHFGDCQVHLEFKVPAGREVMGQRGGNSGVFLMGKYEVQVGESHTNITYPDGQAGAVYGQAPPLVNPATPQGEWQSFDIIFKAPVTDQGKVVKPAEITVLFNGVVVQASFEIQGPTQHRTLASYPDNHPAKGPLLLQWHNDPIAYRNIWIRDLGESE